MVVLDASAVLALLRAEPGSEIVRLHIEGAVISAVNWQEVIKELLDEDLEPDRISETLSGLDVEVLSHDASDAFAAAKLAAATRKFGRGLGDRSCMALAIKLGVPALTTDRAWAKLEIPGLQVMLAR